MDSIAIVGIGCRFPGASTPEDFWQLLIDSQDLTSEVPAVRWCINKYYEPEPSTPGKVSARCGGYLKQPIDQFDAEFFRLSPAELENIDPQQRVMLEVAWEAIEHAGIAPDSLSGSKTGVYVGMSTIDYHRYLYSHADALNPHSGTGTSPCIAANRISFHLNLRGPSFSLDSACSSSLVAIHLACQSLNSYESNLCLAGGVNLMLAPEPNIQLSQGQMLAADGRCKAFDASADGYGRGEGCGVVLLKRLEDAIADEDNVLAVIKGIAVNQDGLSNGLTSPNGIAQKEVIETALAHAKVEPSQISYVESHAVGTPLGDAIEFKSLADVLMKDREIEQTCWIGSVKTNIGHLEAAAGMASVIKVALSLQHEKIPANLHFTELNPYISKKKSALAFPQVPQDWPQNQERFAGVSAFSYGGTNCHLVMTSEEGSPLTSEPTPADSLGGSNHLLTLSAKSEQALESLVQRYRDWLRSHPKTVLADLCFTASTGRQHFDYRAAFVASSTQVLSHQLDTVLSSKFSVDKTSNKAIGIAVGKATKNKRKKIGYLIDCPSFQLFQLGHQLYQTHAIFQKTMKHYETYLTDYWDRPVGDLLAIAASQPYQASPQGLASPALQILGVVVECAMGELWKGWGANPNAIVGYGTGRYAAAYLTGSIEFKEMVDLLLAQLHLSHGIAHGLEKIAAGETFQAAVERIHYHPSKIKGISETSGQPLSEKDILSVSYWQNDSKSSADFISIEKTWRELKCEPTLKVGCDFGRDAPSAQDGWTAVLHQLAALYTAGVPISWSSFYSHGKYRRLHLPTYPFQRKRYWFDAKPPALQRLAEAQAV